ncbi:MFS transporter [Allostreptomyces psammosilenae]|uniref:MFS transporter n=1 Tax=Allostreptomyces psammosilenae TaxID=1892865 RepID=UPI0015C90A33|nr:MFS transporter [Allostreptomyces psammosilenae]
MPAADPRPFGYARLLRTPGAWRFLLPAFVGRIAYAMLTIGIVLLVSDTTGSYGTAGAVAAVTAACQALVGPQTGRLADRFGQAPVLVPTVLLHGAAVTALTLLALGGAPTWSLFAAAAAAGASTPQIAPMVRTRWAARLAGGPVDGTAGGGPGSPGARRLTTAFSFESVVDESTFVVGPVLATALATGWHPGAALAAEVLLTAVGGLLFAAERSSAPAPTRRPAPAGRHRPTAGEPHSAPPPSTPPRSAQPRSAIAIPAVRLLALVFLGMGSIFGSIQVSMTAFTEAAGTPGLAGVLYGVFAGGSMVAGAVYGAVHWRTEPRRRLLATLSLLTAAAAALWTVQGTAALGGLGLLCGLAIAPSLITAYTLVEAVVPATVRTEAFTWMTGSVGLGLAAGSTVAGRLADVLGPTAGLVVPPVGAGAALLAVLVFGRLLRTPSTPARRIAGSGAGTAAGAAAGGQAGTAATGNAPAAADGR